LTDAWRQRGSRRGYDTFQQFLEWLNAQLLRVTERGDSRGLRQLLVVAAVAEQPEERLVPRDKILLGHIGDGNHLIVDALVIVRDQPHREQIIDAQLRFGNAARVARNHRHSVQHGFHHDTRARLGPQRRNQQHARATQ